MTETTPTPAIETNELTKRYTDTAAIRDLTLRVDRGEVFGFLGPNGAGKSTTINILLGLTRQTAGEVRVLGQMPSDADDSLGRRVGVVPERCELYPRLSGREHLSFVIAVTDASNTPEALLERVGIRDVADRRVGGYSTGMAQRLRLALALVGNPDLLILDEPAEGLDPNGVARLREIIRTEHGRGVTIVFSSHRLDQVRAVCDRVGILVAGRLRTTERVDAFNDSADRLRVRPSSDPGKVLERLRSHHAVESVCEERGDVLTTLADPAAEPEIIAELETQTAIEDVIVERDSLEGLFARLTEADA